MKRAEITASAPVEIVVWGGPEGPAGPPGSGIELMGVASSWPPAETPGEGDLWIVPDPVPPGTPEGFAPGDGAAWNGEEWVNTGPIQGPAGDDGGLHIVSETTPPPADLGDLWIRLNAPDTELPSGPVGPAGPPGPAASVDVAETITLDAGLPAEVVNVGNSSKALLSFKIPRGETGLDGVAGPAGAVGPSGEIGPAGQDGADGLQGPPGIQGPAGLGITYRGTVETAAELPAAAAQGDLWIVANPIPARGYVWDDDTAAWVDAGPVQGPQGIPGPQGISGQDGAPGGPGPAGPVGPLGPIGPSGQDGEPGAVGQSGPAGESGPAGVAGPAGEPGAVGPAGPIGETGPAGTNAELLPATAARLGGVKIGAGVTVAADGTISVSSTGGGSGYLPLTGGTITGTLNYAPADGPSAPNGVNIYSYFRSDGIWFFVMPSGKQGYRITSATGEFAIPNTLAVTGAASFASTVTVSSAVTALQFGTTTYNIFGGTGGVAVRNNTTNIVTFAGATITNGVPMVTPSTGDGIRFGSGGAALSRGSTNAKIVASGMLELPATAPAVGEAVRRDYVDGKVIVQAAGSAAPSVSGRTDGTLFVEY